MMGHFNFVGYFFFAFITAITPGPNNYMLLAQGKAFGFRSSLGMTAGVISGFFIILLISGYGIGALLISIPIFVLILKILASIWLVSLGWAIRNLTVHGSSSSKYIGFIPAFFLQFVNPKAWIMGVNSAAVFLPHFSNMHLSVFLYACFFIAIGIPCALSWVLLGDKITVLLKSKEIQKIVGNILFLLMIITVISIWMKWE